MFKNYLKVAIRSLLDHKIYSLINIIGLAVGLAIFTLFAIISSFNTEADRFHKNKERIYAVIQDYPEAQTEQTKTAYTPAPLLQTLVQEFPEIEAGTRYQPAGRLTVKHDEHVFYEGGFSFVDPGFLSIFSFDLLHGDPTQVLKQPFSIVLSQRTAYKYFGQSNPVGETIQLNNRVQVTVTGVLKDVDDNYSSLYFDGLISIKTAERFERWHDDWSANSLGTLLLLKKDVNPLDLEKKLPAILAQYYDPSPDSPKGLFLHPLLDFRLHSLQIDDYWIATDSFLNYVLMITGSLVLFIVCVNFMNLSTARYMGRIKEVGMRKVVGASRSQLIRQFLTESVLTSFLALPFSLACYQFIIKALDRFLIDGQESMIIWNHPFLYKYLLIVTIIAGLVSGIYPAFVLSSFRPARVLKRNIKTSKKGSLLRKIMVVSQFAMTILLIFLTLHWKKTHRYFFETDFGYTRENVVTVKLPQEIMDKKERLRKALIHHPEILSVSASRAIPTSWENEVDVYPADSDGLQTLACDLYSVDYDFVKTMGIPILQGGDFSREHGEKNHVIINELMAERLGGFQSIGTQINILGKNKTVIGVTPYFHFRTVNLPPGPAILNLKEQGNKYMLIRHSSSATTESVIDRIRIEWRAIFPDYPFEPETVENHFREDFRADRLFLIIFEFVDGIAVFVSCLGLMGLASYAVQKRTKEIGIRKTLGASVSLIVRMLIQDFLALVLIANIVALPLSYLLCSWIFRSRVPFYRIPIGADVFVITASMTLVTAVIAVIYQTLKAATANPVDSLRYE